MKKGFTLIELLVVVAILGILAAIGIVSFGGYLDNAKASTTSVNHKNVVSSAMMIIHKCALDNTVQMMIKNPKNNGTIPNLTLSNIPCYGDPYFFWGDFFINDMENRNGRYKNTYKSSGNRVQQPGWCTNATGGDSQAGFVWINSRKGWDYVTICTCVKTPCNGLNIMENTIYFE